MASVRFKGGTYQVDKGYYANGRLALVLIDELGNVQAKATINVPEVKLNPNEVIIKNYSENEGMGAALIEAGIVIPTGHFTQLPHGIQVPICEVVI